MNAIIIMNEIVNKYLLAGGKFMPETHLKQLGFTYSICEAFTKNKERIQKFNETVETLYIYRNELDKACFQHDIAYGHFKDLAGRTASDKVVRDEAFNFAKNPNYDGYQRGLVSRVYKFLDKMSPSLTDKSAKGGGVNNEIKQNEQLPEKLHKVII